MAYDPAEAVLFLQDGGDRTCADAVSGRPSGACGDSFGVRFQDCAALVLGYSLWLPPGAVLAAWLKPCPCYEAFLRQFASVFAIASRSQLSSRIVRSRPEVRRRCFRERVPGFRE